MRILRKVDSKIKIPKPPEVVIKKFKEYLNKFNDNNENGGFTYKEVSEGNLIIYVDKRFKLDFFEINSEIFNSLNWEILRINRSSDSFVIYLSSFKRVDKPRYLYHITPKKFVDDILKKGIKPRSNKDMLYSKRVFLSFDPVEDSFSGEYGLIRVDTTKFKKFNIYKDVDEFFSKKYGSVWTPTHIPNYALELI